MYSQEELAAVKDELSLSGLDFAVLQLRVMRKSAFFTATALFLLFAAFPCHSYVLPHATAADGTLAVDLTPPVETDALPLASAWYAHNK